MESQSEYANSEASLDISEQKTATPPLVFNCINFIGVDCSGRMSPFTPKTYNKQNNNNQHNT